MDQRVRKRPAIDFTAKDLEHGLIEQLDREAEQRLAYKAWLKRLKAENPRSEAKDADKAWAEKMEWLSERMPSIVFQDGVDLEQMKREDRCHDDRSSALPRNCRTNNLIWHLKVLDDPLAKKI